MVAFIHTYDTNKNVTGETTGGVMASYSWTARQDAEDRLIDWDSNTGEERDWDLSLVGDWDSFTRDEDGSTGPLLPIVQPRTHTDAHEVDDIDGTPADHDAKGNMTDDGAVTGGGLGGSRTFAWDFDNRLTSVTMHDGKVHSFTYDALGRRVSKKIDNGVMGGGPFVETVYVCATSGGGLGQVVAEYLKGQAATNPERHFVYGRYVDEPLILAREATRRLTGSSEMTTRTRFLSSLVYYHRNRKYDIVGITGTAGAVLERYTYTPYGEVTILDPTATQVRTVSAVDNPYAYTGRRWESETGLYYFRARYFGPNLGRFLGRDPLGYVDGYSLYAGYFGWIFTFDPLGLTPWTDRRSTESVQGLVGVEDDGKYGPKTSAAVKSWQRWMIDNGYMSPETESGNPADDGKWGDQTEDAFHRVCFAACDDKLQAREVLRREINRKLGFLWTADRNLQHYTGQHVGLSGYLKAPLVTSAGVSLSWSTYHLTRTETLTRWEMFKGVQPATKLTTLGKMAAGAAIAIDVYGVSDSFANNDIGGVVSSGSSLTLGVWGLWNPWAAGAAIVGNAGKAGIEYYSARSAIRAQRKMYEDVLRNMQGRRHRLIHEIDQLDKQMRDAHDAWLDCLEESGLPLSEYDHLHGG